MAEHNAVVSPRKQKRRGRESLYPHQMLLNYGDDEKAAIETTQKALVAVRGASVSLSETVRLLITDKQEAARIEAMALAIGPHAGPRVPVELSAESIELLVTLQDAIGRVQGALNAIFHEVEEDRQRELDDVYDVVLSLRHTITAVEEKLLAGGN